MVKNPDGIPNNEVIHHSHQSKTMLEYDIILHDYLYRGRE